MRKRLFALAAAPILSWTLPGCRDSGPPSSSAIVSVRNRHVLFLHLDGYRADLTRTLLEGGRLPRLQELVRRGRASFRAGTVDKSETMKVIQSYLTSRLDTEVVGWWQFDRGDLRFRNYWLDPAEVLSYALGLTFPKDPTIQDFLAAKGENLVAGMSLARRGVPFENYGRAYAEGIEAVGSHTYYRQAHATMSAFLDIHRRIEERSERPPALSTLLLAAADEFSHAEGVTIVDDREEHCFHRDEEADETIFELLDEGVAEEDRYFTRIGRARLRARVEEVCLELPRLGGRGRAHPSTVLSMVVIDLELGRLLETFRAIGAGSGESLFDRTLFLVFGDHGMVDTPHGLPASEPFIAYLNRKLSLDGETELGIDDTRLPLRLQSPEADPSWQSPAIRRLTLEADAWAREFLEEIRGLLRDNLHEKYWWLLFLRSILLDPKLDQTMGSVSDRATSLFRALYLRSVPEYREAELHARRELFDRRVRLVYGGGALNNAEIFLPSCDASGACTWERRPSYDEILSYRGGKLLEALLDQEAVGLIFIRRENELYSPSLPRPERTAIEVRDRAGNRGVIEAQADGDELLFRYRTDPSSPADPLGYERWGRGGGSSGTYNEWNDRTIEEKYVNVVGGIGSYLHSSNSAIGDVLLMHADGWNFGDNRGGHGGVHREEKTTFLLASGPSIGPGELMAGKEDGSLHHPTLLDLAPTALDWLGYSRAELEAFGRDEFARYLDAWIRAQREEILSHLDGMDSLARERKRAGLEALSLSPLLPRIERLLEFVEADREATLERLEARRLMGNRLDLGERK